MPHICTSRSSCASSMRGGGKLAAAWYWLWLTLQQPSTVCHARLELHASCSQHMSVTAGPQCHFCPLVNCHSQLVTHALLLLLQLSAQLSLQPAGDGRMCA